MDVSERALQLADKLVEDNRARVEVGTLAPLDIVQAEAEAANRRQTLAVAEATLQTAELALKRYIVSGTEDPLWRQELRPVDLPSVEPAPTDIEGAVRKALERRTDLITARRNLDSADVTLKYYRNQSLPALDLLGSYGAQGIGGTQFIRSGSRRHQRDHRHDSRRIRRRALPARQSRLPNWNLQLNLTYNIGASQADAQYARSRLQKNQSQARLRALELQVATEVTNAALVGAEQPEARRGGGRRARAGRKAAGSRAEQVRSRHVHQLLRRAGAARSSRRAELGAARAGRLPQVARHLRALQEAPAGGGGGAGNIGATTGTATTGDGPGGGQ